MKRAHERTSPWSVPVRVHEVPETGRHFDLMADEQTRALIAQIAGLRSLPRLEASIDVARRGTDGLRVVGQVSATVGQTCVVTLGEIENQIVEKIDLVFAPGAHAAEGAVQPGAGEMDVAGGDAPEPLLNETVDLGAVATEFMMLGIDPYPRKPGAVFEAPKVAGDSPHPFAALARLRGGQGGGKG
jgi:hypothetical protein